MIFNLGWCTHDGGYSSLFEVPEGTTFEEFKQLCDRLINEALSDAADGKPMRDAFIKGWLGLGVAVREAFHRLEDHGYRWVDIPTVTYVGGEIIQRHEDDEEGVLTPETMAKVLAFNKVLRDDLEDRLAKREMRS
jgi:hypothetical protein